MGLNIFERKQTEVSGPKKFEGIEDNEFEGKEFFYKCFDISNNSFLTYVRLRNVRYNDAGSKSGDIRYFVYDTRIRTFDAGSIHDQPDTLLDIAFSKVKPVLITDKAEKAKLLLMGL